MATRTNDKGAVLCSKKRTNGQQCNGLARKGTVPPVCIKHGGQLPNVKAKAQERLREALDPAVNELIRIALSGEKDADKVRAIREIFERAGFGEAKRLEVQLTDDVLDAEIARLTAELAEYDNDA